MSTILGADGRPPEKEEPEKSSGNGHSKSELRDVRTVPTGVLLYNLMLCSNGLQMNKMTIEQMQAMMHQQKMVVEPPEMGQLRAILEHQHMARDVMIGEINHRFKDVDDRRLAGLNVEVTDLAAPADVEPAPV